MTVRVASRHLKSRIANVHELAVFGVVPIYQVSSVLHLPSWCWGPSRGYTGEKILVGNHMLLNAETTTDPTIEMPLLHHNILLQNLNTAWPLPHQIEAGKTSSTEKGRNAESHLQNKPRESEAMQLFPPHEATRRCRMTAFVVGCRHAMAGLFLQ